MSASYPCKGGPLDGQTLERGTAPPRLYLIQQDDESLHLYEFNPTSMSSGDFTYVGEVIEPKDQDIIARANEAVDETVRAMITEIVKIEVAAEVDRQLNGKV